MKRLLVVVCLVVAGCSTVSMNCPNDHVVTATLNGPNLATVASQLAAIVGPLAAGGVLAAPKAGAKLGAAEAGGSDGTLSVKTIDLFGVQQYSCGNASAVPVKVTTP